MSTSCILPLGNFPTRLAGGRGISASSFVPARRVTRPRPPPPDHAGDCSCKSSLHVRRRSQNSRSTALIRSCQSKRRCGIDAHLIEDARPVDRSSSSAQLLTLLVRLASTFNHWSRSSPESSTRLPVLFRVAIGSSQLELFVASFGHCPVLGRRLPRWNVARSDEPVGTRWWSAQGLESLRRPTIPSPSVFPYRSELSVVNPLAVFPAIDGRPSGGSLPHESMAVGPRCLLHRCSGCRFPFTLRLRRTFFRGDIRGRTCHTGKP